MITSKDNEKLKLIRSLHERRGRERAGLFLSEGEDLLEAGLAAGAEPKLLLTAAGSGIDGLEVEPELLAASSTLGSGTRVIAAWERPNPAAIEGPVCVYLHGLSDPANVGAVIRSAHALVEGTVILGPDCADPYSPKAVRASMGSVFARPPARAELAGLTGTKLVLDGRASTSLADLDVQPPVVVCLGAEREGLPTELESRADARARIPMRPDGPDSLNVAMAATVALYDLGHRMAAHA